MPVSAPLQKDLSLLQSVAEPANDKACSMQADMLPETLFSDRLWSTIHTTLTDSRPLHHLLLCCVPGRALVPYRKAYRRSDCRLKEWRGQEATRDWRDDDSAE